MAASAIIPVIHSYTTLWSFVYLDVGMYINNSLKNKVPQNTHTNHHSSAFFKTKTHMEGNNRHLFDYKHINIVLSPAVWRRIHWLSQSFHLYGGTACHDSCRTSYGNVRTPPSYRCVDFTKNCLCRSDKTQKKFVSKLSCKQTAHLLFS